MRQFLTVCKQCRQIARFLTKSIQTDKLDILTVCIASYEGRFESTKLARYLGSIASSADPVYAGVGIISFRVDTTIVDDPLKSVVHVASVASVIGGVAVHEFLLGQADEVPGYQGIDPLHCSR